MVGKNAKPPVLTLRDLLAAQMMPGLIVETPQKEQAERVARDAYLYADAMLKVRDA